MGTSHGVGRIPLLVGLLVALAAAACSSQQIALGPLEQRAQGLDKALMCPICPGESIDQSQTELAQQMRQVVREKLAEGWSEAQIKGFFTERYGPSVLMEPPREGFHLVAWAAPPVAVLVALGGLLLVLRRLQGERRAQPTGAAVEGRLQEYLQRAEALLEQEAGEGPGCPGDNRRQIPEGPGRS